MGRAIPVYNEKKILEVTLRLYFHNIPSFTLNYEKLTKCNPTFGQDKLFSILLKYWQISKYKAMLSQFSFPKREEN